MKKRIIVIVCGVLLTLAGCGAESEKETGIAMEAIQPEGSAQEGAQEVVQEVTQEVVQEESEKASADVITQEQALEAIKNYCYANNPDIEGMIGSDDYTLYFDVSTNEANEIVVLYRAYTGAQIRYYIDPASGEVYVTELVPGIIDDEQKTDETFNIRNYM